MIKLLSLFSGIGAFEKALDNLGIEYELVGYCEIDKFASRSYSAVHKINEAKNFGDITKLDEKKLPKDIDLVTYGFPCQDISVAGNQKGFIDDEGNATRSGLFFEALRVIRETKPKIAIAENVKNLTSKRFKTEFEIVLSSLEEAGYNNYWKVLNAKDYGIPQNRERVFIVSIRKDIDHGLFKFPKPFPLEKRLKDMLEDEVDEKFYLSNKMIDYLFNITEKNKARGNGNIYKASDINDVAKTITTREGSRVKDNFIEEAIIIQRRRGTNEGGIKGNICPSITSSKFQDNNMIIQIGQMYPNSGNPQAGKIYGIEGISSAMDSCQGGNRMPKIVVK